MSECKMAPRSKKNEAQSEKVAEVKVTVIGDGAVGKSSLIRRWAQNKFQRSYLKTLGVDITDKVIDVGGGQLKMVMWDIAGQEEYKQFRSAFYSGTQAVVMVADVTNPATFESLPQWRDEVEQFVNQGLPSIFLANKCDLVEERKVLADEVDRARKILGLAEHQMFETSALSGQNVDESFLRLAQLILKINKQ